ncbi:MAG: response regulator [Desulfobacteraceae bacterium]|nr:response regulator [Desulfobacteraceae bacterium]
MGYINSDMKVLIADNSLTMRRIVRRFFANNGFYNIEEAKNGKEALEIIDSSDIDLIISDLHMPVIGGMNLLKKVKTNSKTEKIPFIVLTVEANQKTMNKAISLMVDSYIVKPISEDMFIAEVERVLKSTQVKYL